MGGRLRAELERLTGRDCAAVGIGILTGVAMYTGVGEVAMGLFAIGLDIYNVVHPE